MPKTSVSVEEYRKALEEIPKLEGRIDQKVSEITSASCQIMHLREGIAKHKRLIKKFWVEHGDDSHRVEEARR